MRPCSADVTVWRPSSGRRAATCTGARPRARRRRPSGSSSARSQPAICFVRRSWICRSRANSSTTRASLRQADDPLPRQVADVRDPVEREQVVHAQRVERDRARRSARRSPPRWGTSWRGTAGASAAPRTRPPSAAASRAGPRARSAPSARSSSARRALGGTACRSAGARRLGQVSRQPAVNCVMPPLVTDAAGSLTAEVRSGPRPSPMMMPRIHPGDDRHLAASCPDGRRSTRVARTADPSAAADAIARSGSCTRCC